MKSLQFEYSLPRIAAAKVLGTLTPAAFVGPFAPTRLVDRPPPELPREDWVRVDTRLAGICGSDLKQVKLDGAWDNPLTALISFPHVLGHEAVGTISEVGLAVTSRKVGDRVLLDPWLGCLTRGIAPLCPACATGAHNLCRNFDGGEGELPAGMHIGNNSGVPGVFANSFVAHESQCLPIPDAVSDEAAVLGDPFSVSLHSILRAPPPAGEPVLVYGLGALGLSAIAALKVLYPDTPVFAIGRHPQQVALARRFGADEIIDGAPAAIIERIAELTHARPMRPWSKLPWLLDGVAVVYDTVGSPQTLETGIRITRAGGTVVLSGVDVPRRFEWTPIYFKEISLLGSNAFAMETLGTQRRHALEIYLELCEKGLDLSEMITHRFALSDWRKAFRTLFRRHSSGALKVVLEP